MASWSSRHNPGNNEDYPYEVLDEHGQVLGPCRSKEEATVAAAAPDLLEACQMAVEWLDNIRAGLRDDEWNAFVDRLPNNTGGRRQLRAAIAKATT